jgi:hypothetical protein
MQSNNKVIIVVIILIIVSGLAWILLANNLNADPFSNTSVINANIAVSPNINMSVEMLYQYSGLLTDVSGGSGFGEAKADFENSKYELLATFENLPDPEGLYFYEGWIVRSEPQSVISTGVAVKENGMYKNAYTTNLDLTDHDFYVLTLEPDDGNPAPAAHILEGQLSS